jgi:hypothetical protein
MVDLIVDRREMKAVLASTLRFMGAESAPDEQPAMAATGAVEIET